MPEVATPTSVFGSKSKVSKRWLIFLAFALGSVITVAVSYLAVTSYMDRNAKPAYFAAMAGKYYTKDVVDVNRLNVDKNTLYIELKDNGRFDCPTLYYSMDRDDWVTYIGTGGTWSVTGDTMTLDGGSDGRYSLKVVGDTLLDSRTGRAFYRR